MVRDVNIAELELTWFSVEILNGQCW